MQPLNPARRQAALNAAPMANAARLMEEYELLLAERFTRDPDAAPAPAPAARAARAVDPEERLKELHRLLFPSAHSGEP